MLALKMVVYVFGAPLIMALAAQLPRRRLLATLDLVRAGGVVAMLFVTEVWQVYALIVLVNACSAGFTPTFQATVPDVLGDAPTYARALSYSRLAYELEALLSPALAAAMLAFISYDALFAANGIAFLCSAALVVSSSLPARRSAPAAESWWARLTFGTRRYLATPRLRGLLALNVAVAAASATMIVNTVVYVRDHFGRDASDVAWALGASGLGAMVAALALPRLLRRVSEREAMLAGGLLLPVGLALAALVDDFGALLLVWLALGVGLSLVQTPSGLLVRRSGSAEERPALFAAQFSLSHACFAGHLPDRRRARLDARAPRDSVVARGAGRGRRGAGGPRVAGTLPAGEARRSSMTPTPAPPAWSPDIDRDHGVLTGSASRRTPSRSPTWWLACSGVTGFPSSSAATVAWAWP